MHAHAARLTAGAVALWLLASAGTAAGQEKPIEPDRPDFTNGAHLVPPHAVQVEAGYVYHHDSETEHGTAVPIAVRFGVFEWLEAAVAIDALVTSATSDLAATGSGALQVGAKIRLWRAPDGQSLLSLAPAVDVPTSVDENGTTSRDPDVTLRGLWGFDMGSRAHLDLNLGVGSIRASADEPRFIQHLVSGSFLMTLSPRWTPYFDVSRISRENVDGTAVVAVNTGVTYLVRPHIALDAGMLFGATQDAPDFAAFGGISFFARRASPRPRITSVSAFRGRD